MYKLVADISIFEHPLTGIISFDSDDIAEDDVTFLVEEINTRYFQPPLYEELKGCHFEPLNDSRIEILGERIVQFFNILQARGATEGEILR
jgi:hypothetical protein